MIVAAFPLNTCRPCPARTLCTSTRHSGRHLTLHPRAIQETLDAARTAQTTLTWQDQYAEPFHVEDLARLAGMSPSAFHRHFQTVTALSPIQFQKQLRLQQARLLLAARPGDVTGVAHRVGYDSPSQFSREYRRQYGHPPTQPATRLGSPTTVTVCDP